MEHLINSEGSLALQYALLLAIVAMATVIGVLWRTERRASRKNFDELLMHHDKFAAEVRQERGQWQGVLLQVVKDNTTAMTGLKDAIRQMIDMRK